MPAIDQRLGFDKLVKFNYFPGWHQQATIFELIINKDEWNGLTPELQAQIEIVCKAQMTESFAEGEAIQYTAMQKNLDENGVTIVDWSPEMLERFHSTWSEVAKEEADNDAFFAKVYDDLNTFREGYELWKKHAFLPR